MHHGIVVVSWSAIKDQLPAGRDEPGCKMKLRQLRTQGVASVPDVYRSECKRLLAEIERITETLKAQARPRDAAGVKRGVLRVVGCDPSVST